MMNRRTCLYSLVGILSFGLIKPTRNIPIKTTKVDIKKTNIGSNYNDILQLFVYSFIVKAIRDKTIESLDASTFECFDDPTQHRQMRYGWYGWMRCTNENGELKMASAIDIDTNKITPFEVASFVTDARILMRKTIDKIKENPSYSKLILEKQDILVNLHFSDKNTTVA